MGGGPMHAPRLAMAEAIDGARSSPQTAIEASGLARRYGATLALHGVDLQIRRGERVALLGPNGAGKTTLIRILALSLAPTAGSVRLQGVEVAADPVGARRQVGLVGHRAGLYEDLSARENLRLYGRLYGVGPLEARIQEVLEEVEVEGVADRPVRTLSRGLLQRVSLARAILHDPPVLLMDEPETGLDRDAQEWLAALVLRWAALERCVLFATHRLDWAARVAERAVVLNAGAIRGDVALAEQGEVGLVRAYEAALVEPA